MRNMIAHVICRQVKLIVKVDGMNFYLVNGKVMEHHVVITKKFATTDTIVVVARQEQVILFVIMFRYMYRMSMNIVEASMEFAV